MLEACEYCGWIAAGADRETCRDQRILDLEFADQRQFDRMPLAAMLQHELLRKALDGGLNQPDALTRIALATDGDDTQMFRADSVNHFA